VDPKKIADLYYDAWINHAGDMTDVPLAADFALRGPVASFDDAAGYGTISTITGFPDPTLFTAFGVSRSGNARCSG
jgi:hypothetical protein